MEPLLYYTLLTLHLAFPHCRKQSGAKVSALSLCLQQKAQIFLPRSIDILYNDNAHIVYYSGLHIVRKPQYDQPTTIKWSVYYPGGVCSFVP